MLSQYYTLTKINDELQQLIGCKIIDCSSQERDTLDFSFYDNVEFLYLHFSGIPNLEAIFLTDKFSRKKSNSIELFQKIMGEIVQDIFLLPRTRVFKLELINFNLYLTLFGGSKNNVIATNKQDEIIDSFSSSTKLIGTKLDLPLPNYFELDDLPADINILKALSYSELLLGKYYSAELLNIIKIPKDTLAGNLTPSELNNVILKAKEFSETLINSKQNYILENSREQKERIFSLIPLSEFPEYIISSDSPSESVHRLLIERIRRRKFKENFSKYSNFSLNEYNRAKKQFFSLESEKLKINLISKYKLWSELLFSYSNLKEKGLEKLTLTDYEGIPIRIDLDSKLTVIENAEKFYQKIKNLKKSIQINSLRKDKIQQEFLDAENRLKELQSVQNLSDLKQHIKNHEKFYKSKMAKEEKEISERFKTFNLSENAILYVGKDSRNNDELTFGFGKPNDFWFHLRGGSGSHCILKFSGKGNPSKEIIEKASSIAAYFSSQRNGGYVPVAYTQRKYVRKPKGANPGAVIISKEEVILVEPKIEFN